MMNEEVGNDYDNKSEKDIKLKARKPTQKKLVEKWQVPTLAFLASNVLNACLHNKKFNQI